MIADLFHRMKYMERRGSGLKKIINETEKLPGYTKEQKPEFYSTPADFRVVLKNVNYNLHTCTVQDSVQVVQDRRIVGLLEFCSTERSRQEMQEFMGIASREYFRKKILRPLLDAEQIKMTMPSKPNSRNQRYVRTKK